MADQYADLDIDPAVLADVTRVVQELMKLQQQDLQDQLDQDSHEASSDQDDDMKEHASDRDITQDSMDHADRREGVVALLSVNGDGDGRKQYDQSSSEEADIALSEASSASSASSASPASLSPSSSSLAVSTPSSSSSSATFSLASQPHAQPSSSYLPQSSTQSFTLQDSALKPESTHLAPSTTPTTVASILGQGQQQQQQEVSINTLSGQKTPTRATTLVKPPTTNPDEDDHQYFKHSAAQSTATDTTTTSTTSATGASSATALIANSGSIPQAKTPASSPTKAVAAPATPTYETIPRVIPASASPATRPRRKKALLIGINYFGDPNQLLGCINDTRDVFGFLNGYYGFRYQDTVMLTDDQIYEDKRPTGANIRYWMKWLVKDAEPQDSLFFHYAGHGGRIKDFSYNGRAEH
ncbi:Ca(2+)-dependent cysteine protease, partial [Podila epigama]